MGVLRLSNEQLYYEKQTVGLLFYWMRRECRASIMRLGAEERHVSYYIEGEGIPKDSTPFYLNVSEIVPRVLVVTINEFENK